MKRVGLWAMGIGLFITVGFLTVEQGYAEEEVQPILCPVETLKGVYVFTATGYNIVASVPQPIAIVEVIDFHGDGTLTVPAATVSINGGIVRSVNVSGEYTVDFNLRDISCRGTLTFLPNGPHFDIFIAPTGKKLYMIQTDANTVLAGTTKRVSPDDAE